MSARTAAWLLAAFLLSVAHAEVAIPPLASRVTDLTGTLTAEQQKGLEEKLAAFEQKKGSQIAVLIVPTTKPETIEQYSIRVVEQFKLGRKGVDDGVLLLVAKQDRKMRIEVGYGLEGVLPDAIAKRIIDEVISPHFKQSDFYGGISAGLDNICKVVDGERLPEPPTHLTQGDFTLTLPIILGVIILLVSLRLIIGTGIGTFFIVIGVFGSYFSESIEWLLFCGVLVLIGFVLSFTRHRGSGWTCTSSVLFSGRSSGSGGGFSGGGGSFGGGGASGSW